MNTATFADRRPAPTVPLLGAHGWIIAPVEPRRGIVVQLRDWLRRTSTRQDIADLDERLLRDIGLTRHDALVEARKHFWEA